MGIIKIYINEKVTTWIQTVMSIKAENEKDALNKVVNSYKDGDPLLLDDDVVYMDTEEIDGCREYLTPEDNNGYSTIEISGRNVNTFWENGKAN